MDLQREAEAGLALVDVEWAKPKVLGNLHKLVVGMYAQLTASTEVPVDQYR